MRIKNIEIQRAIDNLKFERSIGDDFDFEALIKSNITQSEDTIRDIIFILVPKLALVIVLEVIAFQFFRMHQSSQVTARQVRDEITTLRFKTTAFYAAIRHGSNADKKRVYEHFLGVERRRTLSEGQVSVDLERERLDAATSRAMLDRLAEAMSPAVLAKLIEAERGSREKQIAATGKRETGVAAKGADS